MSSISLEEVLKDVDTQKPIESGKPLKRFAMKWGGAAGDGLQSTGLLITKYFNTLGYSVHGYPGNQSAIRGGHIWYHIEISSENFATADNVVDMIVALDANSVGIHLNEIKPNGVLIYNNTRKVDLTEFMDVIEQKNLVLLGIPLTTIAREIDLKKPVLGNTVAIGAILEILSLPLEPYHEVLRKRFPRKDLFDMNVEALQKGFEFSRDSLDFELILTEGKLKKSNGIVINGNHAVALGAAAAGLKFVAQYPITPASSILTYLSQNASKFGIVVRQAEDELAAIAMIIGASWTGVRAMTATSGPGISLMAENVGLAGITETPVVIVDAQRGGPSTGMPTKTEQGDLHSVINLSHGEFPRAVFSPKDITDAYHLTIKAFNIAEKYQIPVFILSDFGLAEGIQNVEPFNFDVKIDRGKVWEGPTEEEPEYHRYALTEDGISPRLFAPHPDGIHVAVGAEHDVDSFSLAGHSAGLSKARKLKVQMFDKRFRKLEKLATEDMDPPEWVNGDDADITLIGWGSIGTAVEETVELLNEQTELKWNGLIFTNMFPLPVEKVKTELNKIKKSIIVEINYTGQLEQLLFTYTGWRPNGIIRHIDGELLTRTRMVKFMKNMVIDGIEPLFSMPKREWNNRKNIVINQESFS